MLGFCVESSWNWGSESAVVQFSLSEKWKLGEIAYF